MIIISLSLSGLADEKAVDEILVLSGVDNPVAVQFDSWIVLNPGDLQDGECYPLDFTLTN